MGGLNDHDQDDRSRTERSNERKAYETALAAAAKQLVAMSTKQLGKLRLPEEVLDAVDEARRIKSRAALDRQLRVVRRAIRGSEPEAILDAVDELLNPSGAPSLATRHAATWTERLIAEHDGAIDAFVDEFPNADRQQLRSLLRNLTKAAEGSAAARKARTALQRVLERAIDQPSDPTARDEPSG